jgi:hypothetical protein
MPLTSIIHYAVAVIGKASHSSVSAPDEKAMGENP